MFDTLQGLSKVGSRRVYRRAGGAGFGPIDRAEFDSGRAHQSAAIRRSNIAFRIWRWFERKENSPR